MSHSVPHTPHTLDAPPWQRIETIILSTARDIRAAYDQCFEPLGLNLSQASVIGYIAANGSLNQTQLASALVLGRAATGTIVDQLEQRGLVRRVPDPADRRVWLVENTEAGEAMSARIIEIDVQIRGRLRHGTNRAQRQELAETLARMSSNACEHLNESQQSTLTP